MLWFDELCIKSGILFQIEDPENTEQNRTLFRFVQSTSSILHKYTNTYKTIKGLMAHII